MLEDLEKRINSIDLEREALFEQRRRDAERLHELFRSLRFFVSKRLICRSLR